jgi:hypothetical protein
MHEGRRMGRLLIAGALALIALGVAPPPALAHGDEQLVDGAVRLAPGESVGFDGELHYHRVVGRVEADGPVSVRLVDARTGAEVLDLGEGTLVRFNALVRCCDEAWAPHTLVIVNPGTRAVTATARARLVHDDLAVMVDGAESGTRASIVILGLCWSALVWRALRRPDTGITLRRPVVAFALLVTFVLGLGVYARGRYGIGGAPSVVAGNADVPILPLNPIVSRASLLMGLTMVGWALAGLWWVRARSRTGPLAWTAVGGVLAGAVLVVAVLVTVAYGRPLVQAAWVVAAAGPVAAAMVYVSRERAPGLRVRGVSEV